MRVLTGCQSDLVLPFAFLSAIAASHVADLAVEGRNETFAEEENKVFLGGFIDPSLDLP